MMMNQPFMRAYSLDLREETVDAVLRCGTSGEEAAGTPSGVRVFPVKRYPKVGEKGRVTGFRDGIGRGKGSSARAR
jgi:hypothetical protein